MKHLPNLLTLANLFCGCIAIAFIMNAQPYPIPLGNGDQYWVYGTQQAYLGSLFIFGAAIFDMLDGFAARALKVFSPIGKDLDSLADIVSFGVAPSMILFKMLWGAYMKEPNAFDAPMLAMAPAFLIACFGALRLARFNVTHLEQRSTFIGMPIPAAGMFIATLPLINWYNPEHLGNLLQSKWVLYAIIAVLCWLMVSKVRFFKLFPASYTLAHVWPQLVLVLATLAAIPFFHTAAIPVGFVLYIILSIVHKQPAAKA